MRRRVAAWTLTAVVAITAAVVLPGASAARPTREDRWRAVAETAAAKFRLVDRNTQTAHAYAYMAEATGRLVGWTDPLTRGYLAKVYARRNPDGGWGLGAAYDAFGDGTTNPASTTYTVTLAGHVGPALLAGHAAGVVPTADVQAVVDLLMSTPRVPVPTGQCVAYSRQPADTKPGYCVHNVNAGVAHFLHQARGSGFTAPGLDDLITAIVVHETAVYRPEQAWWPYAGTGPNQDVDHQSYSAQSMYPLAYAVGWPAVHKILTTDYSADPHAGIAYARLASTGGAEWCGLAAQWIPVVERVVAAPPAPQGTRLAQAANYAARASRECR